MRLWIQKMFFLLLIQIKVSLFFNKICNFLRIQDFCVSFQILLLFLGFFFGTISYSSFLYRKIFFLFMKWKICLIELVSVYVFKRFSLWFLEDASVLGQQSNEPNKKLDHRKFMGQIPNNWKDVWPWHRQALHNTRNTSLENISTKPVKYHRNTLVV